MAIIFGVFVALMILGVPIFFVLTGVSVAYFIANDIPAWTVIQRQFSGLNSFIQVAVPLFILAGNLMDAGGSLERIVRFAKVTVGRFKGGLAHVNIMASMMFAGVTGSAVADVAALGPLEIQMMTDNGYEKKYATALTCASASVGPIIPPSLPMIMYGVVSGTSVGALLIAGLVPGLLLGAVLMAQVVYYAHKYNFPTSERYSFKVIVKEFFPALSSLSIVIIVLGGIYTGFFTPTEAAGFACLVAFILGKFVYKKLKWRDIPAVLIRTVRVLGTCSAIFAIAACFSYVIALENVPRIFAEFLLSISVNKYVMLLLVNVLVLFVGCFMEGLSIILIITPLILPMLLSLGIDPVHIGVILAVNTTLGLLTPPLGLSLFMASSVTELPVLDIAKKAMPMFLALVTVMLLLTYIPQLSLFLPNLVLGN
jgi:tripartite ATP-independent transporter DctM subunit